MRRKLLEKGMGNPYTGRLRPLLVSQFFQQHGLVFHAAEVTQFWPVSENDRRRITQQSEKLTAMFDALGIPRFELFELDDDERTVLRCLHVARAEFGSEIARALVVMDIQYVKGMLKNISKGPTPLLEGQILPDEPEIIPRPAKSDRKKRPS